MGAHQARKLISEIIGKTLATVQLIRSYGYFEGVQKTMVIEVM